MVAQRGLSFKKKIRLTVMNMDSQLLNNHSVHPPLSIELNALFNIKEIM